MNIMIAYDGSRNAKLALAQTITMFRRLEPKITLVAVAENPRDITSGNEDLFQEEVGELKQHLKEALELCESEQVSAESLMLEGASAFHSGLSQGPGSSGQGSRSGTPQPSKQSLEENLLLTGGGC